MHSKVEIMAMNRPWTHFIHIGIVHPMIFPECGRGEGPILETASRIINDEFFGAIEVSVVKDPETKRRLVRLLNEGDLDVIFCGGPVMLAQKLDLNALDDSQRKKSVEGTKQIIDMAYEDNAKICVILSGPMSPAERKQKATELLIESLRELCDYAKSRGKLMITLEHFGNCIIQDKTNPMYGDQHPRFGAPNGENDVPELAAFLKALEKMGYFTKKAATVKPVISFEVKPAPGESSEAILAGSKRVL